MYYLKIQKVIIGGRKVGKRNTQFILSATNMITWPTGKLIMKAPVLKYGIKQMERSLTSFALQVPAAPLQALPIPERKKSKHTDLGY